MTLADRVLRTVRKHRMFPDGARVLVALSGGPDSVALTLLLRELERAGCVVLAGLVHINHGLRREAPEDHGFCELFARGLGLELTSEEIDVRAVAKARRLSLEDAGRKVRYEAFERARLAARADAVATGHTRDDQAETFLLRLIRGAGPRGLAGIYPVAGRIVRPLIEVRRDELREYLAARGQAFCEDETNRDLAIPRNRIRHELLPYLAGHFSPGIVDVLAREADLARADADHLDTEAIDFATSIVLRREHGVGASRAVTAVEIDAAALTALHPAIGTRVARLALSVLAPGKHVGFDHVERLLALASGQAPGGVSLPGQHATLRAGRIVLERQPFRPFANSFHFPLSIPGEVALEPQGWAVSAQQGADLESDIRNVPPGLAAAVQVGRVSLPLAVRSRRPGDWMRPSGLGGKRRKLQDVLVDRKVARELRDSLPLVVDRDDRIVWIVGGSVAEDFRVTEPSQGVILLKARRLGGPG